MSTVQGAAGVNPTITAGTDDTVASQASAVIQTALENDPTTTVGGGYSNEAGATGVLVVDNPQSQTSVYAPNVQYFIVGDTPQSVAVTAGGAANQAVILGMGAIAFYAGGGSGTIAGGDGNKLINIGAGTNFGIYTGVGNDTISLVSSPAAGRNTVQAGAGNNTINLGAAPTQVRSTGHDTIAVSAGATTVQAVGNAQDSVAGGSGSQFFAGGTASSTVSGGSGSATVIGGAGGGQFTGGSGGNNLLIGGAGTTYLTGAGAGDLLIATGSSATTVLRAGAGNETLLGGLSSASNIYEAGSGSDLIIAGVGNDTIYAGSGAATVSGGAGYNDFVFNPLVAHGGNVTITDFAPGADRVSLVGYSDQPANLAANAQSTSSGSRIVLSDGTSITFIGLNAISTSYFG